MQFIIVVSACLAATSGHIFSRQPLQALPVQSHSPDQIDDSYEGSEYHYSWRHDGNQEYTGEQAVAYCQGLDGGWQAVSIETTGENNFLKSIIRVSEISNIWTGAARAGFRWNWPHGRSFRHIGWPNTGRFRPFHQPRPNNRDQRGRNCLAIMNNNDGLYWQDVSCENTKPVICERRM